MKFKPALTGNLQKGSLEGCRHGTKGKVKGKNAEIILTCRAHATAGFIALDPSKNRIVDTSSST